MKTQSEILARLRRKREEFLNFEPEILLGLLDYEHAREFLLESTTAETWTQSGGGPKTDASILADAKLYMDQYGWDKARNHRGISAGRTVQKMTAWLWLLGHDDLADRISSDGIPYAQYGTPILKAVAEEFGWPVPDDPILTAMMRGDRCPQCVEDGGGGCG